MRREETEGASLREGSVKVALEQWTERTEDTVSVDFNAVSALEESGIGEGGLDEPGMRILGKPAGGFSRTG